MKQQTITSDKRFMEREFRTYKKEVTEFYDAVDNSDYITQNKILRTADGDGLVDIFKRDYDFACRVLVSPSYAGNYWISYLYEDLPGANKHLSKAERVLVEQLVMEASNYYCPSERLKTHLNEEYKDMLQTIKKAKNKLIDLSKCQCKSAM